MRYSINSVLMFLLLPAVSIYSQEWELFWSDEFNEGRLDTSNWTIETGSEWGNNELEYCTDGDNILFNDSCIIIELREERMQNKEYTSGRILSKGKVSSLYGRIEVRVKPPFSKGLWPAVWTLGSNYDEVGWPECGEIDIFEMACGDNFDDQRGDNAAFAVVHYSDLADRPAGDREAVTIDGRMSEEFHTFACEWDEENLSFFFDSSETPFFTFDITRAYLNEFHFPHFLIINLSMGGPFAGLPDNTTFLPQRLTIDWIRWYKKKTAVYNKHSTNNNANKGLIDKIDGRGIYLSSDLTNTPDFNFYTLNGKNIDISFVFEKNVSGSNLLKWNQKSPPKGLFLIEIIDRKSKNYSIEKILLP